MNSKNAAFENSLQCLQHSLAVLSIVALVVNDHIFKVLIPSWLTGKLSDFAGLFFFPFVLAAGLSLLLCRTKFSTAQIGAVALGMTGLSFFLLKTNPLINTLSAQSASAIFGMPVAYALDPSDLLALVMLLPAWLFWQKTKITAAQKRSWVFLVVGVLASLASTPISPPADVVKLSYQNNHLYVFGRYSFVRVSDDLGSTWPPSLDDAPAAEPEKSYPIQACDPQDANVCYRTFGDGKVEITSDHGVSWQTAWSLPPGRLGAIERLGNRPADVGPYDLLIAQNKQERVLFVALGTLGLLQRSLPNGEWVRNSHIEERYSSVLVPLSEPDFTRANQALGNDWLRWELISILTFFAAGAWLHWKYVRIALRKGIAIFSFVLMFIVFFFYLAICIMLMLSSLLTGVFTSFLFSPLTFLILYIFPFFSLVLYIVKLSEGTMANPMDVVRTIAVSAVSTLGILIFGILPLILWIQGIIEQDIHVVFWTVLPNISILCGWFYFLYHRSYRDSSTE